LAPRSGSGVPRRDAALQPWQLYTLAALVTASAVAFLAGDRPSSVRVALILTVFSAATIGVAALRTLAPFASSGGPAVPPVVGGRTRAALEREKTLALRAIKDLEFDHAMGKVSAKDFSDMSDRLRARAVRLLHELDATVGYRDEIEREIARRLQESRHPDSLERVSGQREAAPGETEVSGAGAPPSAAGLCAACATRNDVDARFCKACGTRLGDT
jgi:hypothetical protein